MELRANMYVFFWKERRREGGGREGKHDASNTGDR